MIEDADRQGATNPKSNGALVNVGPQGLPAEIGSDPYGARGYGSPFTDDDPGLAVTARQYLYMVLKRKWLILSITFALTVLGGARALMTTPLYRATARVQIEREPVKVVEGEPRRPRKQAATTS